MSTQPPAGPSPRPILYILRDGEPEPVEPGAWGAWFETSDAKRLVAITRLRAEPGGVVHTKISTCFLGVDQGLGDRPVLWETAVSGDGAEHGCDIVARYTSRLDALAGHHRVTFVNDVCACGVRDD